MSDIDPRTEVRGMGLLAAGTAALSAIPVVAQLAMRHLSPAYFTGLWMACASVWAVVLVLARNPARAMRGVRGGVRTLLLLGVVSVIWVQSYFAGVARLDAALVTMLVNSRIAWGVILGFLFFGERPGRAQWVSTTLALTGVALILVGDLSGNADPVGMLFVLISAVFYVLVSAIVKRFIPRESVPLALLVRFGAPAVTLTTVAFLTGPEFAINRQAIVLLTFGSLAGPFLSFLLIFTAVPMVRLGVQQLVQALGIVFTAILSAAVFGQTPTLIQYIGGVTILASLVLVGRNSSRPTRRPV